MSARHLEGGHVDYEAVSHVGSLHPFPRLIYLVHANHLAVRQNIPTPAEVE